MFFLCSGGKMSAYFGCSFFAHLLKLLNIFFTESYLVATASLTSSTFFKAWRRFFSTLFMPASTTAVRSRTGGKGAGGARGAT